MLVLRVWKLGILRCTYSVDALCDGVCAYVGIYPQTSIIHTMGLTQVPEIAQVEGSSHSLEIFLAQFSRVCSSMDLMVITSGPIVLSLENDYLSAHFADKYTLLSSLDQSSPVREAINVWIIASVNACPPYIALARVPSTHPSPGPHLP